MIGPNSYHPILALASVAMDVSPTASVADAQRAVVTLLVRIVRVILASLCLTVGITLFLRKLFGKIWNERNE
jgi:imidazoleglycerol phosphate dehydratase HisB